MKKYEIGNKIFLLKKLVLCQTRALFEELAKGKLTQEETDETLFNKLNNFAGKEMPRILSCVLIEEGKIFPKNPEDFEDIVSFIDNNIDINQVVEVMRDFLALSLPVQISTMSEKDNERVVGVN